MDNEQITILAIDDDESFLHSIKKLLQLSNFSVITLSNPFEAIDYVEKYKISIILLDIQMPGVSGDQLISQIQAKNPTIPIIIISGTGTINIAVELLKKGAVNFIEKPVEHSKLIDAINKELSVRRVLPSGKDTELTNIAEYFIGNSNIINELRQDILQVAKSGARVLITGETGTGKELVAYSLYQFGNRNKKKFSSINCPSFPAGLLESELFGHLKGAFTDARSDRKGILEESNGGTVFLDEIGDLDISLQPKLLRFLENDEIQRIGSDKPLKVDVRIIAATNQDLLELSKKGKFRADLYHRLKVVQIHIPPLRERPEDILPLAYHFISIFNEKYDKNIVRISPQAEGILMNQKWEGNVRELKNVIDNLMIFTSKQIIEVSDIIRSFERGGGNNKLEFSEKKIYDLHTAKIEFEKQYILQTLRENDWQISKTAEILNIDRTGLHRKINEYGIKNEKE